MPRRRYTHFFITVDTHTASENEDQEKEVSDILLDSVRRFVQPTNLKVVLLSGDPSKLKAVKLKNASVEVGDKYRHIHVHFNLEIEHETELYLKAPDGRTINNSVADFFNSILEPRLGHRCFVAVRLGDTRAQNYATKNGQAVPSFSVSIPRAQGAAGGSQPQTRGHDSGTHSTSDR